MQLFFSNWHFNTIRFVSSIEQLRESRMSRIALLKPQSIIISLLSITLIMIAAMLVSKIMHSALDPEEYLSWAGNTFSFSKTSFKSGNYLSVKHQNNTLSKNNKITMRGISRGISKQDEENTLFFQHLSSRIFKPVQKIFGKDGGLLAMSFLGSETSNVSNDSRRKKNHAFFLPSSRKSPIRTKSANNSNPIVSVKTLIDPLLRMPPLSPQSRSLAFELPTKENNTPPTGVYPIMEKTPSVREFESKSSAATSSTVAKAAAPLTPPAKKVLTGTPPATKTAPHPPVAKSTSATPKTPPITKTSSHSSARTPPVNTSSTSTLPTVVKATAPLVPLGKILPPVANTPAKKTAPLTPPAKKVPTGTPPATKTAPHPPVAKSTSATPKTPPITKTSSHSSARTPPVNTSSTSTLPTVVKATAPLVPLGKILPPVANTPAKKTAPLTPPAKKVPTGTPPATKRAPPPHPLAKTSTPPIPKTPSATPKTTPRKTTPKAVISTPKVSPLTSGKTPLASSAIELEIDENLLENVSWIPLHQREAQKHVPVFFVDTTILLNLGNFIHFILPQIQKIYEDMQRDLRRFTANLRNLLDSLNQQKTRLQGEKDNLERDKKEIRRKIKRNNTNISEINEWFKEAIEDQSDLNSRAAKLLSYIDEEFEAKQKKENNEIEDLKVEYHKNAQELEELQLKLAHTKSKLFEIEERMSEKHDHISEIEESINLKKTECLTVATHVSKAIEASVLMRVESIQNLSSSKLANSKVPNKHRLSQDTPESMLSSFCDQLKELNLDIPLDTLRTATILNNTELSNSIQRYLMEELGKDDSLEDFKKLFQFLKISGFQTLLSIKHLTSVLMPELTTLQSNLETAQEELETLEATSAKQLKRMKDLEKLFENQSQFFQQAYDKLEEAERRLSNFSLPKKTVLLLKDKFAKLNRRESIDFEELKSVPSLPKSPTKPKLSDLVQEKNQLTEDIRTYEENLEKAYEAKKIYEGRLVELEKQIAEKEEAISLIEQQMMSVKRPLQEKIDKKNKVDGYRKQLEGHLLVIEELMEDCQKAMVFEEAEQVA